MGSLSVKKSINTQLTRYLVLCFVIPFILAAIYISSYFQSAMEGQENKHSKAMISQIGSYLEDSVLAEMENTLQAVSADARLLKAGPEITDYTAFDATQFTYAPGATETDIQDYFRTVKAAYEDVNFLFIGTETGGYVEYPAFKPVKPYDPRTRPWYQEAFKSEGIVISNPYRTQVSEELVFSITRRIKLNSGQQAVVGMTVSLDKLGGIAARQSGSHLMQSVMVLDSDGHFVASDLGSEWILKTPAEAGMPAVAEALSEPGKPVIGEVNGVRYLLNSMVTPKYHWQVVTLRKMSDISDSVSKVTAFVAVSILSFLMMAILMMRITIMGVTGALKEIAEAIYRVNDPGYDSFPRLHKIGLREDEVGLISRSVNKLFGALKKIASTESTLMGDDPDMFAQNVESATGLEVLTIQALEHTRLDQELIAQVNEQLSHSQRALLQSQEQLLAAFEIANDAFFDWNLREDVFYLNTRFYEFLDYRPNAFKGSYGALLEHIHPEDRGNFEETLLSLVHGRNEAYALEFRMVTQLDRTLWVHGKGRVLEKSAEGEVLRVMGLNTDITEQKLVEGKLRRINDDLETKVHERTQELMALNEELQAMNTDILEMNINLQKEVEDRKQAEASLVTINTELGITLDHLRTAQKQLLQSEKMASLGVLVTGVAHEVNTPIGVGVTAASYLKHLNDQVIRHIQGGTITSEALAEYAEDSSEAAKIILTNLERAAVLITSFKNISVDQSSDICRTFKVKAYLQEILYSLRPNMKPLNPEIVLNSDDSLALYSYPGAFSQIVTNLVMNAVMHGFDGRSSGQVDIMAEAVSGGIRMRFCDNGVGMDEELLPRIFDPFFTTKRGKGGSGLGLFLVHNLVEQQFSGTITCSSVPGKGTCFELVLHEAGPMDIEKILSVQ